MRLEPDGVVEPCLVVGPDDVDRAHADPVAREPDPNVVSGSFSSSKNALSAVTSASSSRTSPSTTMPSASGRRASSSSSTRRPSGRRPRQRSATRRSSGRRPCATWPRARNRADRPSSGAPSVREAKRFAGGGRLRDRRLFTSAAHLLRDPSASAAGGARRPRGPATPRGLGDVRRGRLSGCDERSCSAWPPGRRALPDVLCYSLERRGLVSRLRDRDLGDRRGNDSSAGSTAAVTAAAPSGVARLRPKPISRL